MHGAKFRLVGVTLLSGAALAVGCSGDDSGGDGSNNNSTTTSPLTTTIGNATNDVSTATSSQTTSGTANGTTNGTTGSTGSGTGTTGGASSATGSTGSNGGTTNGTTGSSTGSGGGAGACQDDAPTGGNAAGAGGEGGASDGTEPSEGFNFVDESEVAAWSVVACADDAANCFDEATVTFSCGVIEVEINWPAAANAEATRVQLQNVVPEDMLRDLSGKTLYARVRMTSASAADHGYDFNVIAQDYIDDDDDSNDWKWFSTCYNGSGNCPENPSGETYSTGTWVPLALPMRDDLAPEGFAFDNVRKLAFEIGTKYWAEGAPFSYDSAPTSFEIDYVAW